MRGYPGRPGNEAMHQHAGKDVAAKAKSLHFYFRPYKGKLSLVTPYQFGHECGWGIHSNLRAFEQTVLLCFDHLEVICGGRETSKP